MRIFSFILLGKYLGVKYPRFSVKIFFESMFMSKSVIFKFFCLQSVKQKKSSVPQKSGVSNMNFDFMTKIRFITNV